MTNLIVGATQNAEKQQTLQVTPEDSKRMAFYKTSLSHLLEVSQGRTSATLIIEDEEAFEDLKNLCQTHQLCLSDDCIADRLSEFLDAGAYCTPSQSESNAEDVAFDLFDLFYKAPIIFAKDGCPTRLIEDSIFIEVASSKGDLRDILPVVPNTDISGDIFPILATELFNFRLDSITASDFISSYKIKLISEEVVAPPKRTYIMTDASGYYKIGQSASIENRLKTLRTGNPTLRIVYASQNNIEAYLHKKIRPFKVIGEWFDLSKALLSEIVESCDFQEYDSLKES